MFLAIVIVMTGALRGAGDTIFPLLFSFVGLLFVRIPLAYYLCWDQILLPFSDVVIEGYGMGVQARLVCNGSGYCLKKPNGTGRFQQGGWKHIKV